MNNITTINIYSFVQRPDLIEQSEVLLDALWPQFMSETAVPDEYWEQLYQEPIAAIFNQKKLGRDFSALPPR
ncbi:hypothetical protein RZ760_015035 [Providencia rettgeri]|nr:hypothetical protein [Providencia rettgeri]